MPSDNPFDTPLPSEQSTAPATATSTPASDGSNPFDTPLPSEASQSQSQPPSDYLSKTEDFIDHGTEGFMQQTGLAGLAHAIANPSDTVKSIYHAASDQIKARVTKSDEDSQVGANAITMIKHGDYLAAAQALGRHLAIRAGQGAADAPGVRTTGNVVKGAVDSLRAIGSDIQQGDYGSATGRGLGTAAQVALTASGVPEAEGAELLPEVAPEIEAASPSLVSKIAQGEKLAQAPATDALSGASHATEVPTVAGNSLRETLSNPIDAISTQARSNYDAIDQAAGTDFKGLNSKLSNTNYQLRLLTDTEEDLAKQEVLEKARTATIDKIEEAKQQALNNGVGPSTLDAADKQFKQAEALKDLEKKVFKNPAVVQGNSRFGTPETIKVDSAVKALQRLQDDESWGGSRLEQALGKPGANRLLQGMYKAQRVGASAVKTQTVAKWLGSFGAVPAGVEAYKALSGK